MNERVLLKERPPQRPRKSIFTPEDWHNFLQESVDLFLRNRQGHLIHRCYLTEKALIYGGKFSSAPANYMKPAEIGVIPIAAANISSKYPHLDGFIGIENGPGMETAMRSKSGPFFGGLNGLHTWVGRDLSPASINLMPPVMSDELSDVRIVPDMSDFNEAAFPKGLGKGRRVIAEFGMTVGNMEGFPEDGFPVHIIRKTWAKHRSRMKAGDIYTFTFDCNQNGGEVERAYNSKWTTFWGRELFQVMANELPIEGDFDPKSYVFRDEWEKQSHGGFNYMIAQRKMDFAIAGHPITIEKGEGWGITNSYKMPEEIAEDTAEQTGFEIDWNYGPDRRVPMPALVAI